MPLGRIVLVLLFKICSLKLIFLTDSYYPVSECERGSLGPDNFKGIEVQIFRDAFGKLKWKEGADYDFECVMYTEMLEQTLKNDSVAGAFCAVNIDSNRMSKGYRFSQPTIENGLSIVTKERSNEFFFIKVLDWKAAIITILVFPLIFAVLTYFFEGRTVIASSYLFQFFCNFFYLSNNIKINNLNSKLLQKMFLFNVLIFISFYTARLITQVTEMRLGQATSVEDLKSKKILTLNIYTDIIANLQGKPLTYDENASTEEIEMLFKSSEAEYDIILQYIAYKSCDLSMISSLKNIVNFKFGMAFGPKIDDRTKSLINQALLDVNAEKTYNQRVNEFFMSENIPACQKSSLMGRENYNLSDVKEMGYIYLSAILFGLALSLTIFFYFKYKKQNMDKAEAQVDLREKKNKEVSQGVSMIFALYLKGNHCKVQDHLLHKLNDRKKKLFNIFRNKNRAIKPDSDSSSLFDEILKSPGEEFNKYVDNDISLYELVSGDQRRVSLRKRNSVKVFPSRAEQTEGPKRASARGSRKSIIALVVNTIGIRSLEVPATVKRNLRDYLDDKFVRKATRSGTWFSRATTIFKSLVRLTDREDEDKKSASASTIFSPTKRHPTMSSIKFLPEEKDLTPFEIPNQVKELE